MEDNIYTYMLKEMEKMLVMYMGEEAYSEFSKKIAKDALLEEIEKSASEEFKAFVKENSDKIFADAEQTDCPWK